MVEFDIVDEEGASHGPREPLGQAPDGSLPLADREWLHVDPWGIPNWVWVLLLWPLAAVVIVFAVFWTLWAIGWTPLIDLGRDAWLGYEGNILIGIVGPVAAIIFGIVILRSAGDSGLSRFSSGVGRLVLAILLLGIAAMIAFAVWFAPPLGILLGLLLGPVGSALWRRAAVIPVIYGSAVVVSLLSLTLFAAADAHLVAEEAWWGWGVSASFLLSGALLLLLLEPLVSDDGRMLNRWTYWAGGGCFLLWTTGVLLAAEGVLTSFLA